RVVWRAAGAPAPPAPRGGPAWLNLWLSPPASASWPAKLAGRQTPSLVPPVTGPAGYPLSKFGPPVSNLRTNWPGSIGAPVICPRDVTVQSGVSVTRQFVSTVPKPTTSNTDWPAADIGAAKRTPRIS